MKYLHPDDNPLPQIIGDMAIVTFGIYAIFLTFKEARLLKQIHLIKQLDGYPYDQHDFKFDSNQRIFQLALYSTISGTIGGIVGTSGIVVLNLVFYAMNLHPLIIANTSQYLSLISTLSVTFQFLYMDVFNFSYALYLGMFVLIGSFIGIHYVNKVIKITGRQSIIVIALAGVLLMSFVTLPLKYLIR